MFSFAKFVPDIHYTDECFGISTIENPRVPFFGPKYGKNFLVPTTAQVPYNVRAN